MDPSNWSSFIFQSHTQNPLQVGTEIQSRFFAAQGCSQSPFQVSSVWAPNGERWTPLKNDIYLRQLHLSAGDQNFLYELPQPQRHTRDGRWTESFVPPASVSCISLTATTTAPPQQTATPAESLQVDLLPVLAAAQETAAAAAVVAAATGSAPSASTVDTAALKQQQPSASEGGGGQVAPSSQTTQAPTSQAASATQQQGDAQKKPKSKGPYICSLCAKEFKNGYNLRRHEAIHTGAKASRAGPTTMKMPTMVPLSLLSVSAIGGTTAATPAPAEGAGNTAGSGAGLVTTTASGKRIRKNHACEMCGKAFRDVYHLNRHKLSHSDEKPYQCPVCQQRFKRKDRMSYHVRSHDGAVHKPYICSHCGKSFSRPDHLNSHVRQVHSTERPFKCETCEAAFATKDRLRAHTVRHEEKVPCHVCGKMLSAAYITDHMKVHSQGPNHVCELCNKGFTTAAYLRVHAVKDHGLAAPRLERFLCKLCGVHCKTPAQLNGHLQTHAGEGAAATEGQPLR
ncbi:myc-associated zinc finger protein isoform X2 [Podarcis muralis]|uniref:myc-associated zinc finger protein isoform X2 n=1 Tax=Podarcis raffonei TaxID=65483 RepID=UPI002329928D|nr:myc-associated zinc finger protein isoform X2 [Podarcis raffonei]